MTRVIIVSGLSRSGTTLLERLLGELPGVVALGARRSRGSGLDTVDTAAAVNRGVAAVSGTRSGRWPSVAGKQSMSTGC